MKTTFVRVSGIALIIAGIGGLLFSLTGIGLVWYFRPKVTDDITTSLRTTQDVLVVTADGLDLAEVSLNNTISSLVALEQTVGATAVTLDTTTPMLNTLVDLTRQDLPRTLDAAQRSLDSAQESARIIDRFLSALSFLPGVNYNPEVPLNEALQEVANSLNDLPASLDIIETSLGSTSTNLEVMQSDIQLMATDISAIRTSLVDSQVVIDQYQTVVSDLELRLTRMENELPEQITTLAWVLTFVLVWAAFTQFGLTLQGWGLLQTPVYDILDHERADRPVP
jgi:flagellin-like hook-associated protein FlgL